MKTILIYHFEDDGYKREKLQQIVDALNRLGVSDGVAFEDALGSRWANLLTEPQRLADTIWEAATNENSICLVDIVLESLDEDLTLHTFNSAAEILERKLKNEGLDQIIPKGDLLLAVLSAGRRTEDVSLASLMVAIFKHFDTRFVYASNAMLNILPAINDEFKAQSISWPEGRVQSLDQNIVEHAAGIIYELALRPLDLYLDRLVDLGHPSSQGEKLEAADVLRRFIRLDETQFLADFGIPGGGIHENAMNAVKSISGARAGLDLKAAWLLAFGVYRSLFPRSDWRSKWDPLVFCGYPDATHYCIARANVASEEKNSRQTRLETIKAYINLCERLFQHDRSGADILVRVDLRPERLEFVLEIPFSKHLGPTLVQVFRRERGEAVDIGLSSHDTSSAIFRFVVSSLFSAESAVEWVVVAPPHAPISVRGDEGRTHVRFG